MAQMYLDLYLSKHTVPIQEYNSLAMGCLQIAMKLEEVDDACLNPGLNPSHQVQLV